MNPTLLTTVLISSFAVFAKASPTIPLPAIPDRVVDITSHGATPDNSAPSTKAIQQAIAAASHAGGGRVLIPAGKFLSGPLTLASNIDLHLAKGATLSMSTDPADFPVLKDRRASFITAQKAHDVRLSGEGTIDGQGESWWKVFLGEKAQGIKTAPRRPQLIFLDKCERVEIDGITTLNPPNTHYSLKNCKDVTIHGITATAPDDSPNTDALNLSIAKNVLITDCQISTGDDNIVLLCGGEGNPAAPQVENVTIRDCKLGFGHGLSIGSYTSGGVKNVTAENITFDGTTSGLRLKAGRDRGGLVEGIRYKNITMKNVRYPIFITSYYPKPPAGPAMELPSKNAGKPPVWRDITIENVTITDSKNSIVVWGLPDQPVTGVTFKNIKATTLAGARIFHAKNVVFSDVTITPAAGPVLEMFDAAVSGLEGVVAPAGTLVKFK